MAASPPANRRPCLANLSGSMLQIADSNSACRLHNPPVNKGSIMARFQKKSDEIDAVVYYKGDLMVEGFRMEARIASYNGQQPAVYLYSYRENGDLSPNARGGWTLAMRDAVNSSKELKAAELKALDKWTSPKATAAPAGFVSAADVQAMVNQGIAAALQQLLGQKVMS
jgi:hypothetical protein